MYMQVIPTYEYTKRFDLGLVCSGRSRGADTRPLSFPKKVPLNALSGLPLAAVPGSLARFAGVRDGLRPGDSGEIGDRVNMLQACSAKHSGLGCGYAKLGGGALNGELKAGQVK
jgi:hypothetical protein